MTKEKDDLMIVTIRIKQKVSDLFKVIMIKKGVTVTENLINHIWNQVNNYEMPKIKLNIDDKNFSKINIRIERELYTNYKVQMVLNHTTPTADIIRHILKTIEENQDLVSI